MNKFTDIKSFEVKARRNLFNAAGVLVVDSEFTCEEYRQGEIRVYSSFGDRLEYAQYYANLPQWHAVVAEALECAACFVRDAGKVKGE